MTSQQTTKLVLATLTVVTLVVLCIAIWSMLGTLATAPAPLATPSHPLPSGSPAQPAAPQPVAIQFRTFPARVGKIMDISTNPDLTALPATKVSIDLSNTPLADALADFGQAASLTGLDQFARMARARDVGPVTLQLKDAPLLEAIFEFCSRTGSVISGFSEGQLTIQPAPVDGGIGRWAVAGPFALDIEQIVNNAQLDARANPAPTATLHASFFAEPGVHIAPAPMTAAVELTTEAGGPPIPTQGNSVMRTSSVAPIFVLQSRWTIPPDHPRKIARLNIVIPVILANKMETLQYDLGTTDPLTRTLNGVKIEISPMVAEAGGRYSVKLRLTRGQADQKSWQQTLSTVMGAAPQMMTDGRSTRPGTTSISGPPEDRTFIYSITPAQGASPPQQFIVSIPTDMHGVDVTFEFSDLALP